MSHSTKQCHTPISWGNKSHFLFQGTLKQDAREGSVILTVEFDSLQAVHGLIDDSVSGKLTEHFRPIQDAVRKIPGYETYTLEVDIYDESYLPFLREIGILSL